MASRAFFLFRFLISQESFVRLSLKGLPSVRPTVRLFVVADFLCAIVGVVPYVCRLPSHDVGI